MDDKDELTRSFEAEVRTRFGDAFIPSGERLGPNDVVYRSRLDPRIEISVVAGGEGHSLAVFDRYRRRA